jgi:PAS domain S-box-containing protein
LIVHFYRKLRVRHCVRDTLKQDQLFLDDLLQYKTIADLLRQLIVRVEQEKPQILVSIILFDPVKGTLRHQVASSCLSGKLTGLEADGIFLSGTAQEPGDTRLADMRSSLLYPALLACSEGKRIVITRTRHGSDVNPDFLPFAQAQGISAICSEPLHTTDNNKLTGVLTFYYRDGHEPDRDDWHRLDSLHRVIQLGQLHHDLRAQVQLQHALIEYAADPMYVVAPDENFRQCYLNQAAVRFFGYSREECLKLRIHDYDPYATPERLQTIWQTLRQKQSFMVQTINHTARRRDVPVEVACHYFRHEGREYIAGYFRERSAGFDSETG